MTAGLAMTNCPSEETLAAFLDGRLDGEARRRVVEHLADCGECREVMLVAGEVGAGEVASVELPFNVVVRGRFGLWWAAPAVAAALAIFLFMSPLRETLFSSREVALKSLIEASESLEHRRIDGRLSEVVAYREPEQVNRGSGDDEWDLPVLIAAQKIAEEVKKNPSPENLRALAGIQLLRRKPEDAVATLERLLLRSTRETEVARAIAKSTDAALLVDLSAAYLARAGRQNSSHDIALAAESATRAWNLGSTPPSAWNRAIALEQLKLTTPAIEAWQEYLRIDPSSQWAAEALKRLADLEPTPTSNWYKQKLLLDHPTVTRIAIERIARSHPRELGLYAERLLVDWSRENSATRAGVIVRRTSVIGEALAQTSGDYLALDCARAIENARDGLTLIHLRQGLKELGDGRSATSASAAGREYAASEASLASVPSPPIHLATISRALNAFEQNNLVDALDILRTMESSFGATRQRYPSIIVRAKRLAGVCLVEIGQPHAAVAAYAQALEAAERTGDIDGAASLHALLAQTLSLLGRTEEAWPHRVKAFELAPASSDSQRFGFVVAEANVAAVEEDLHQLSALFTRLATVDGRASKPIAAGSLMWSARRLHDMGHGSDAIAEITRARSLLAEIPSPDVRSKSAALLDLAEGTILADREPVRSIQLLDDALRFFQATEENLELAQLFEARARSHDALDQRTAAAADLARGIAEIEKQRAHITDPALRTSFVETRQRLFERMMRTALEQERVEDAFHLAERSRTRSLLDDIAGEPVTLRKIQAALDPGVVLVEYYSLNDILIVWIVKSDAVEQRIITIRRRELAEQVTAMNEAAKGDDISAFRATSVALRTTLLEAVDTLIQGARLLVVVPDVEIAPVPFGGLCDSKTGRYLVEDFDVVLAPSASVFERLTGEQHRHRSASHALPRVAVFGNAVVKGPLFQNLERLSWVEPETREIQSRIAPADVFLNDDATVERFLATMKSHDLVHFAGHAVLHTGDPEFSALVLTGADGNSAPLYAHNIRTVRPSRVSLVVLAACDTGRVSRARRSGAQPLTHAFVAAGVPSVLGSMWAVDDGGAAKLMSRFYAHVSEGRSYASALRMAKIDLLSTSTRPRMDIGWLGYELMGVDAYRDANTE